MSRRYQRELEETSKILESNIKKLIDRGESLQSMAIKAQELQDASKLFRKRAEQIKQVTKKQAELPTPIEKLTKGFQRVLQNVQETNRENFLQQIRQNPKEIFPYLKPLKFQLKREYRNIPMYEDAMNLIRKTPYLFAIVFEKIVRDNNVINRELDDLLENEEVYRQEIKDNLYRTYLEGNLSKQEYLNLKDTILQQYDNYRRKLIQKQLSLESLDNLNLTGGSLLKRINYIEKCIQRGDCKILDKLYNIKKNSKK